MKVYEYNIPQTLRPTQWRSDGILQTHGTTDKQKEGLWHTTDQQSHSLCKYHRPTKYHRLTDHRPTDHRPRDPQIKQKDINTVATRSTVSTLRTASRKSSTLRVSLELFMFLYAPTAILTTYNYEHYHYNYTLFSLFLLVVMNINFIITVISHRYHHDSLYYFILLLLAWEQK